MKTILVIAAALISVSAFADLSKLANTETVQTAKKKVCPVVNGKEDCTVQEVKDKAQTTIGDLKSKLKK